MQIVEKQLEELTPYENNPRKNEPAIGPVMQSIQEFGFKVPMVIDSKGVIVCGHTRFKAAQKLGLDTVPCIVADDLTPEQIKAFRLADNKVAESSKWDWKQLEEELRKLIPSDIDMSLFGFDMPLPEDCDIPDPPTTEDIQPDIQPGDIFQLGPHRLMCGDSTKADDVKKLMDGAVADLVVTDPPYNCNWESKWTMLVSVSRRYARDSKITNDNMATADFDRFLDAVYANLASALKPGGAFYICHQGMATGAFQRPLQSHGLHYSANLIWVKQKVVVGMTDYQWKHEPIIYGWKEGAKHYFHDTRVETTVIDEVPNLRKLDKKDLIQFCESLMNERSDVIREDAPTTSKLHPTMKPVRLMARLIRNSSRPGEIVLDLFGGSGSTLIAADKMGRKCYMMEYEPKYVQTIINRWEEETGGHAEKI